VKRFFVSIAQILFVVPVMVGCSDSNDTNSWGGTTRVVEVTADDDFVRLDKGVVFRVNFSFDEEDIFNDQGQVHLVMKLPNELEFREGSAEIDGFNSRDDEGVEPTVVECSDGTYLSFTLIRYDLDEAEPPTEDADAQLKLTIEGKDLVSSAVVEAAADEGEVPFGCETTFIPDEQEVISVR